MIHSQIRLLISMNNNVELKYHLPYNLSRLPKNSNQNTVVKLFPGVGYGSMIATMAVLTYYVSIMSLTIFYFIQSFQKTLPWSECNVDWADEGACNETRLSDGFNRTIPEMYYLYVK